MQSSNQSITQDLVLVGGGHSHAIALKLFGMAPLPGVRLTLITDVYHTPYSGMLPGYVAGVYDFDQCHIDLRPLAQFAQTRLIADRAIALDLENNRVICAHHPPIAFDLLSLDIGSTPNVTEVPGAKEHAIPVKPISHFLNSWDQLVADLERSPHTAISLGIVGGGTGGVELALNIHARLKRLYQSVDAPDTAVKVHLFHRGQDLLEGSSAWVRRQMRSQLVQRGIQVHLSEEVTEVHADRVACRSGLVVKCDRLFWVTQATAAAWIGESGLATDLQGFIQVNDYLQSTSHPQVFATGDIATMVCHPRPKAGVFAVRQGKPLFENLRHALLKQPLQKFVPQRRWLSLIGMGDCTAIATRGQFGLGPHPLIWQWKDHIDRRFMERFTQLQPMGAPKISFSAVARGHQESHADAQIPQMHCAGCGSKVGSVVLERTLQRIQQDYPQTQPDDIVVGLDAPDDAAVIRVPVDQLLVQTVDYFSALVDDPFVFGQIATNHCLSDLFAMGATPQSALAIATLPYATTAKTEETLYQLLLGATKVLQQAQAVLIGGHTTEGDRLAFGLSCNGLIQPDCLLTKGGMQPGQVLILTKALGTGTLFAADMQFKARGRWIESAIDSMLLSNQSAAQCFQQYRATACTDITGFGLLGHLVEMIRASHVAVELEWAAIPILAGAHETLRQGIVSSLHAQNAIASPELANLTEIQNFPLYPILFDPQTSGGLLASVPADEAIACLAALKDKGYSHSRIIGRVLSTSDSHPPIRIKV
ncbi:selenide, water dikinase SelD [Oscillatoria sp. FACHB-1407]|uniref:selenide, water dikinase SelD n=1 Tax=Oscillatoria sp. FACHB-1407 TaxID=2692847 RepID=UPI0016878A08|nr:selenide, water dikinase SelD [Oscillatoria sp. FACHB-1407]MBD2461706.1 selenide, water dikinase SelD [Oscillatoria sp. FACHB-1407]